MQCTTEQYNKLFSSTYSFRPHHGPGVDSAPSENEYQENFLGVKAAGAWGWRLHQLHVPNVMKIWEPISSGTVWATPGLLRETFTFSFFYNKLLTNCSFVGSLYKYKHYCLFPIKQTFTCTAPQSLHVS